MSSVLTEEAIRRTFYSWNPPLNVFGYMPQVDYLNNPSMELISLSFPSMKPLNRALNSESGKKNHVVKLKLFHKITKSLILTRDSEGEI